MKNAAAGVRRPPFLLALGDKECDRFPTAPLFVSLAQAVGCPTVLSPTLPNADTGCSLM
ncbi:hypothetical protein HRbin41_00352 [bacterium HR41]|nr:hypothetical protein HRbin41_00352 [bacterium HR41]